jgi:hypothetical protein
LRQSVHDFTPHRLALDFSILAFDHRALKDVNNPFKLGLLAGLPIETLEKPA